MEILLEFAGWAGAATILGAFLGVSMGWMKAGRSFQLANLLGACAFIVNGAFHEAWPSVTTNVAWCLISAIALFRMRPAGQRIVDDAENPHVQFPGVPDTTDQLSVMEVLTGSAHDNVQEHFPHGYSRSDRPGRCI
jgi:hypothetical protein